MSKLGALHLTKHTGPKHSATVIFFHGSGGQSLTKKDISIGNVCNFSFKESLINCFKLVGEGSNGADMKEWVRLMVKNFSFPHIKVMYPTAPLQPYYPAGGSMSNVWFDRAGISQSVPEKLDSLAKIEVEVKNLIKQENDVGIPTNRIIVGGFSMGGALSFHAAFRWERSLAGVFVFSSFLNNNSIVYQDIKNSHGVRLPPFLQLHGDSDDLVDFSWGQDTYNQLKHLGVEGEFHVMPRLGHSINRRGMELIKQFIEKQLPEV